MQGLHDRSTDGTYSRNLKKKKEEFVLNRSSVLVSHRGLSLTVVGLNLAVFLYGRENPRNYWKLLDKPGCTWTLLTTAFCHKDLQHLSANMFSLVPEIPQVLQVCGQSPYQFVAFYISAAIISSYAQRAVSYTRWTQQWSSRFFIGEPISMGASGVAMAIFAASCFAEPPWASPSFLLSALTLVRQVTLDFGGLIHNKGNIGYAAHLAGAVFGAMYAYFNADRYLWSNLVHLFSVYLPKSPPPTPRHKDLDLDEIVRRLNESA
ncbi:uncharacterized protein CC84DRAFT_1217550 [Paraphaeosphaeria sporulosa]|uniref:Peptidase S54 rhomboid domain-containing protein n=1 Tax=Paraphaeosphaeria sporulosa TaxID=1460663 RepID=A0A177CH88_9PLEO|nr:uncharacterized protein CC84DRAFT_1217550 [Paraphaeosphaeria sporulosa]OAG06312.1 hypothetical protein CC84DRAFT_1217550 [Paraphaeosphaeria sporulosa]